MLNSLSGTSTAYIQQAAAAVAYPDGAEHVDEAKKLIAQSNTKGPQTWLKKYSECVPPPLPRRPQPLYM